MKKTYFFIEKFDDRKDIWLSALVTLPKYGVEVFGVEFNPMAYYFLNPDMPIKVKILGTCKETMAQEFRDHGWTVEEAKAGHYILRSIWKINTYQKLAIQTDGGPVEMKSELPPPY